MAGCDILLRGGNGCSLEPGISSTLHSLLSQEALEGWGFMSMHVACCHQREPCAGHIHWCIPVKRVACPVLMAVLREGWAWLG